MNAFKDFLAEHGWWLIWIVFVATVAYAIHDHRELRRKIKESNQETAWVISRLCLVWAIPVLAFLAAIGTQVSADKSDDERSRLVKEIEALKPPPFKDRLIACLNEINPQIIKNVRAGGLVGRAQMKQSQYEELQKLSLEPEAKQYFTMKSISAVMAFSTTEVDNIHTVELEFTHSIE